jgi:hypothetical protein
MISSECGGRLRVSSLATEAVPYRRSTGRIQMKYLLRSVALCVVVYANAAAYGQTFTFVALGDTAYNGARDYPIYRELIGAINATKPAFSIHIGDIWGAGNCHDAHYAQIQEFFALYQQPVVYTPGDNEWTDCRRAVMGGYDASERLAKLRGTFFVEARSLGAHPMPIVRESDVSPYTKFVENARWERDRVLFFTVHVVGSHNNFLPDDQAALIEANERTQANVAWIRDSFRIARAGGYRAIVMAMHAQMLSGDDSQEGPFGPIVEELKLGGERFAGQVLLVHGDSHKFQVGRPFLVQHGEGEPLSYANITRLEVYGAPEIGAVKVSVDPDSVGVFGFTPLLVKGSQ